RADAQGRRGRPPECAGHDAKPGEADDAGESDGRAIAVLAESAGDAANDAAKRAGRPGAVPTMTRVFVYEYTCAAPSLAAGVASLRAEAQAMLRAVLEDSRRIPGVEPITIEREPDEEAAFRAAVRRADWSLVIAPEFEEILLKRCRWVLEEGGR